MKWSDVQEIVFGLIDTHPGVDPRYINFVDLRNWVLALPDFSDDPARCGEKVLEAIQMMWIEEVA